MTARIASLALAAVLAVAGYSAYRLLISSIEVDVYRERLSDLRRDYASLRDQYNRAVRRTAVTELLVLKSLQRDLVERTRRLHTETADAEVTEAQLRKIVVLGEDQAEIRTLAEMLTRRARE